MFRRRRRRRSRDEEDDARQSRAGLDALRRVRRRDLLGADRSRAGRRPRRPPRPGCLHRSRRREAHGWHRLPPDTEPAGEGLALSSAYVAEAFRLAFPNGATERVIVALTAYFDESGTHANSPAVSVAGYLASDASWSAFADDWREALAIYNIPAFHMSALLGGRGAFTAWPKAKRHPRLMKLIAIANRHVMATFGCAIDLETYRAVTRPRPGTEMISAYNLLAVTCFIEVREYLQR